MQLLLILALIISIFFKLALQNPKLVTIDLIFTKFKDYLVLILLVTSALRIIIV